MKTLISPLDWGLGHATRIIPIIRWLLSSQVDVHVAASGLGLDLLKKNFQDSSVKFHELSDMKITYSTHKKFFLTSLISQFPNLIIKKNKDNKTIQKLHRHHRYDYIISDNRYGVFAENAHNIFITHQVQILSGINSRADRMLLKFHKNLYKNYNEIWVMDSADKQFSLVPKLSHPHEATHPNLHHIGHLSQFDKTHIDATPHSKKKILALLSGPEPARSILYHKILNQAQNLKDYNFTIIAGSDSPQNDNNYDNIQLYGLLSQKEIQDVIADADIVICRSGYSTIMDLMVFHKKAIVIPTPGQTEQEYIAEVLDEKKIFMHVDQDNLNLSNDLKTAELYQGFNDHYRDNINEFFKKRLSILISQNTSM